MKYKDVKYFYNNVKYFYNNVATELSKGALWFGLALSLTSGNLILSIIIMLPVIGNLILDYYMGKARFSE